MTCISHFVQYLAKISLVLCEFRLASQIENSWGTEWGKENLLSAGVIATERLTKVAAQSVVQVCKAAHMYKESKAEGRPA